MGFLQFYGYTSAVFDQNFHEDDILTMVLCCVDSVISLVGTVTFPCGETLLYINPPSLLLLVREGGTGQYSSKVIRTKGGRERQHDQINSVSIENKAKNKIIYCISESLLACEESKKAHICSLTFMHYLY